MTCSCPACKALAARYKNDPALLKFYRAKLLIRGWAGSVDEVEKAYQKAHASWAVTREPTESQLEAQKAFATRPHNKNVGVFTDTSEAVNPESYTRQRRTKKQLVLAGL